MKNGYRVIDIDTHVNPNLDTLVKYVDPAFRPRLDELKPYIRTVGEYNALSIASIPFDRFPGEAPSTDDQAAVAGGRGALEGRVTRSSGHHRVDPQKGVSDENAAGRLADMDLEGRDVDVIIPGTWANGLTGIEDVTLAEGLYSAYHRYMREYCSADPERLRSIILAPAADIEWSINEIKAVSKERWAAAVAIILPEGMPIDHPAVDPLFEVLNEEHLPILHHSFTFEPPYFPGYRDMWGNIAVARTAAHPWGAARLLSYLIVGKVFDRFPNLNAGAAEVGHGWLPHLFSVNYYCRLRRLVLPVHLLFLTSLLSRASAVAGHVKLQDDGVVDHPVNRRGGGHGVGEDALPLREDQIGGDAQRSPFVAFGDEGEKDLGLLGTLGQVAQIVQEQEVEVVQFAQLPGQSQFSLGGE